MINTNGFWLENALYVMGKESSLLREMYRPTTDGEGRLKTVPRHSHRIHRKVHYEN